MTDTEDAEFIPRIDADGDGNYHIVYTVEIANNFDREIRYLKIDALGQILVGPMRISPGFMDTVNFADISVDKMGRSHISFAGFPQDENSPGVYYAQVGSDGKVSVPAKLLYHEGGSSSWIRIDTDRNGNAYLVWSEMAADFSIKWMKISSSGAVLEDERTLNTDLGWGGEVDYPDIAVANDGVNHIIWMQKDYEISRWALSYTSLSDDGDVLYDPDRIRRSFIEDYIYPCIDVDEEGMFFTAYLAGDQAQGMRVEYVKWAEDASIDHLDECRDPSVGDPQAPSLSALANGDAVVFYATPNPPTVGGYDLEFMFYEYSDNTYHMYQVDRVDEDFFQTQVAAGTGTAGLVYIRDDDIRFRHMSSGNNPPIPRFTYSPQNPDVNELITFDASDSYDDDAFDYISEYNFEWGDGSGTGWVTSDTSTHRFDRAGEYTVTLSVRDSERLESETPASQTIRVSGDPINQQPISRLSVNPVTADIDEGIVFDGGGSFDPDGTVEEYSFVFDDGMSTGWVKQSSVSHSYDREGVYTAFLKVRDDDGAESDPSTAVVTIVRVNEPPTATIVSIEPDSIFEGEDVTLTGSGEDPDGTVEVYTWESDLDGVLGSTAVLTIDTLQVGYHTISFKVRDNEDEWSQAVTDNIVVSPNQDFAVVDMTTKRESKTDGKMKFKVVYTDAENDPPTRANLLYAKGNDWKEARLEETDTADTDYTDGKEYILVKEFGAGKWKYAFEFENENNPRQTTDVVNFEVEEVSTFPIPAMGTIPILLAIASAALAIEYRRRGRG